MVERHHQIEFASGALVFPGGKANAEDVSPHWAAWSTAPEGCTDVERALRVAAVREAFEESSLLLARPKGMDRIATPDEIAPVLAQRDAIAASRASFLAAIDAAGLVLALDALDLFAHWITPKGMPKRFDTWFYIAAAPAQQAALHDGGEAVDAVWLTPQAALEAGASGARKIMFPTRLNLALLEQSASARAAIVDARGRAVATVEPWIEDGPDGQELVIDPNAGYGAVREPLARNL